MAFMAIEWATDLARAVGSKRLNHLMRPMRNEHFPTGEYELFRDMLIFSTDESVPIQHTRWIEWQKLIARPRLFEIKDINAWAGLDARFDTTGIRAPGRLARIAFGQLMAADWGISHPDMIVWKWQSARQDAVGFPRTLPRSDMTRMPDPQ